MKAWMIVVGGANLPFERGASSVQPTKFDDRKVYIRKDEADAVAEMLAMKYPQQPVLVFETTSIVETGKPKIINKKITADGEIIV